MKKKGGKKQIDYGAIFSGRGTAKSGGSYSDEYDQLEIDYNEPILKKSSISRNSQIVYNDSDEDGNNKENSQQRVNAGTSGAGPYFNAGFTQVTPRDRLHPFNQAGGKPAAKRNLILAARQAEQSTNGRRAAVQPRYMNGIGKMGKRSSNLNDGDMPPQSSKQKIEVRLSNIQVKDFATVSEDLQSKLSSQLASGTAKTPAPNAQNVNGGMQRTDNISQNGSDLRRSQDLVPLQRRPDVTRLNPKSTFVSASYSSVNECTS